jgi:hypothetical protein
VHLTKDEASAEAGGLMDILIENKQYCFIIGENVKK